jgi:hypothetical protein
MLIKREVCVRQMNVPQKAQLSHFSLGIFKELCGWWTSNPFMSTAAFSMQEKCDWHSSIDGTITLFGHQLKNADGINGFS